MKFYTVTLNWCYFPSGITLGSDKSLHNQGVVEQEHITLVHSPPLGPGDSGIQSPAKTEGVTTHSDSFTNSEVSVVGGVCVCCGSMGEMKWLDGA